MNFYIRAKNLENTSRASLRKAFDTVYHGLLLSELEQIGVRGVALELFRNCVSHRKQYVKLTRQLL